MGKVSGRLTVIEWNCVKKRKSMWTCLCQCGNRTVVVGSALRRGDTKGCVNCRVERQRKPGSVVQFNRLFSGMKYNAIVRNLEWKLSKDDVRALIACPCFYCGIDPHPVVWKEKMKGAVAANGLDRFDNRYGYRLSNVVPCCRTCNWAKGTMSYEDFTNWIRRVCNNLGAESKYTTCRVKVNTNG
mgnify:CR=1 FL=1